jgi:hypothetical protein
VQLESTFPPPDGHELVRITPVFGLHIHSTTWKLERACS